MCYYVCSFLILNLTYWCLMLSLTVSVHDLSRLLPSRAWLLSTITDTADMKLLNFIEDRFEASDLEPSEASQLVLVALNHIVVNREIVKKAQVCYW